ncbi:hypothetical protein Mapa_011302 [Marchantia paleacea]|nr:hypothetical protein Mapa_011302 [Marchantia paleacea]
MTDDVQGAECRIWYRISDRCGYKACAMKRRVECSMRFWEPAARDDGKNGEKVPDQEHDQQLQARLPCTTS